MLADRYELHDPLGQGGMAEVFEATAHGAQGFVRRVAIKRLRPEAGLDPQLVRMFLDEARIASRLHHPGIVAVLDYAVVDFTPFQVLELVDGWDVSYLLRQAKARGQGLPLDVVLCIATAVAHALTYAHEANDDRGMPLGIVHRDVKPSNVLVSRAGAVKLGDFGIALARERVAKTSGFVVRGTPGFMSPEQLLGVGSVDNRTDIFALGCTIHALATGASPMKTEGARAAMLAGGVLELSPALPPSLLPIVERAVKISADARYQSAREMAAALGGELAAILRTDPTTCMMQWLQTLECARRPATTTVLSVLQVASHATVTTAIASTLSSTDRVFTTTSTTQGVPMTIDATAAMSARLVPRAPVFAVPARAPTPARDHRMTIFAVALLVPFVVALIAGGGILIGHVLTKPDGADAGAVKAAGNADAGGSESAVDAAQAAGSARGKPPSAPPTGGGRPGVATAQTAAAQTAATPTATGLAGTGPPEAGGCRCDTVRPGFSVAASLCHPATVTAPSCRCELASRGGGCWQPLSNVTLQTCAERERVLPVTTKVGDPCTAFGVNSVAEPGRISSCSRCPTTRFYPRAQQGSRCVGVLSDTGERLEGVIGCQ